MRATAKDGLAAGCGRPFRSLHGNGFVTRRDVVPAPDLLQREFKDQIAVTWNLEWDYAQLRHSRSTEA